MRRWFLLAATLLFPLVGQAFDLSWPTANLALLSPAGDAKFFQPTTEGTAESGMFGCVRRSGEHFHEGNDIKCLQRDSRGEPLDPVLAVADGAVAFINTKTGLSNYGRYVVLEHRWDGVKVFTLYAHLRAIEPALAANQPVKQGQRLGTLGRSTNTREGISQDRAHLHFEINFLLNPHFYVWYPKRDPKAPPFGNFNGRNLFGIDPAAVLRAHAANPKMDFAAHIAAQPLGFVVLVGAKPFPWLTLHPEQIQRAAGASTVAYAVNVSIWGLPISVTPLAQVSEAERRELQRGLPVLSRVNEAGLAQAGCIGLVRRTAQGWQLTEKGRDWVSLLTYTP